MPARDAAIESFVDAFEDAQQLSPEAREWFYWTNFSRSKPKVYWDSVVSPILNTFPNLKTTYASSLQRDLYNVGKLKMLKPNFNLATVAQGYANALKRRNAPPSHTSPSGETFQTRMLNAGVQSCAGENISFGPANTVLALVLLYIDEGIADLGHRKSLLNRDYSEMGVGISAYTNGNLMVIQNFACAQ